MRIIKFKNGSEIVFSTGDTNNPFVATEEFICWIDLDDDDEDI